MQIDFNQLYRYTDTLNVWEPNESDYIYTYINDP